MSPLETRFQNLQNLPGIQDLLGQTEDLHLDCKEWPSRDDDAQRTLAKALAGFSNAEGGILVIGVEARSTEKDEPDLIRSLKPVADALSVKTRIENLIGNLVEPLIPGVRVVQVLDGIGQSSGFVLVLVPPTDGLPVRSRKDWKFFMRVSAGTFPMEYFQIADMFGRRHRAVPSLWAEEGTARYDPRGTFWEREFMIGIQNSGRGIARFPSLRFPVVPNVNLSMYGLDGNGHWGLPLRPTSSNVILFGGGADDVVYPGTHLQVAKLTQRSRHSEWMRAGETLPRHIFPKLEFNAELAADGISYQTFSFLLPEKDPLVG